MALSLNRGQVAKGEASRDRMLLVAASTWATNVCSGYFYYVSSGNCAMLTASQDTIGGWVDVGFKLGDSNISSNVLTVPTANGAYEFPIYRDSTCEFWLPVKSGQTLAVTDVDKPITVSVSSSVQSADLDNTGTKSLLFVCKPTAEEVAANIVRVRINPAKFGIGS